MKDVNVVGMGPNAPMIDLTFKIHCPRSDWDQPGLKSGH